MVKLGRVMRQGDKQPLPAQAMAKDQVLNQTGKGAPKSPITMVLGGLAGIGVMAYLVLYSHKKPEATAIDVAKVATGTATTGNTRPQK